MSVLIAFVAGFIVGHLGIETVKNEIVKFVGWVKGMFAGKAV